MKTLKTFTVVLLISTLARIKGEFITLDDIADLNGTRFGDSDELFQDLKMWTEHLDTTPCDTNKDYFSATKTNRKWEKVYKYSIDRGITTFRADIKKIMKHLYDHMNWFGHCLDFQEVSQHTGVTNRVHIYYNHNHTGGCSSSHIGNAENVTQYVQLSGKCLGWVWVTTHQILHSLGLEHEQSRSDRDRYIIVHNDRIRRGRRNDYRKLRHVDFYQQPYNYYSIMHYSQGWGSKDGRDVWEPRHNISEYVNQLCPDKGNHGFCLERVDPWIERLMQTDARKLRRMYGCPPDAKGDIYH